ncbi:chitinase [Trujillonella endophytica]|uniref:Chitinase n=1 Tax=Trujillonella endophytica TaxID=673521 RepID=A0A1H8UDX7_9ACTN|nr:glycosyl hydrolase family 18 protein [Trujillella endophytica]SEP01237.1 chitinase [Trujillella endophytica]
MGAPPPTPPGDPGADEPSVVRRLSWRRLGLLVGVVGLATTGAVVSLDRTPAAGDTASTSWSVPYVDVTLTPTFPFQDPAANPARTVALAFVVADPADGCAPSWGGYYSLEEAGTDLELDRRIAQLRSAGGDVMVSLGGQANEELAVACADVDDLTAAYREVVERYDLSAVDLDIEGTALADQAAAARRATALAAVQRERADAGSPLDVWLTLPVAPGGLTADAVDLVRTTLAGDLELTGVNVMTMDYGAAKPATQTMLDATEQAVTATVGQVTELYAERGTTLGAGEAWARVGATPMIGQNDVPGEVFGLADAEGLASFARAHGLGRISLWSLNRDTACSASFASVAVLSNTCSGVDQEPLAFVAAFAGLGDDGTDVRISDVDPEPVRGTVVDDPATSPYPVWRPEGRYPTGYKVVWRGHVYEARWYATGVDPSTPGVTGTPSPWTLLGAVTTSEAAPAPVPTVSDVTTPWSPDVLYQRGDRVLLDGLPYEARWASRGQAPGTLFPVGPDEAWAPLFTIPGEPAGT